MSNAIYIKTFSLITFLTKVERGPTNNDIHEAHFKLKKSGSVQSDLGGGGNGLLGLVMRTSLYLILTVF